jgi:putative flavoprotein involved in K+ transport
VLVVGSGQSGLQIADELAIAGRPVVVAVGRHGWVPRRVYGHDQMRWRWDNGDYRSIVADPAHPKADYPRSSRAGAPPTSTFARSGAPA